MLQIRLSKPATDAGGSVKPGPTESVNVACPDHLVLANLPVAKSLGTPFSNAVVKNVGRRSRRQLGERVHFCVQCDFPIAIYGRLSPCEHAFCLDCARSDSVCYLCDERIQKIQTIKMMEGLFICAAPHCLKSFLKKSDFEFHINEKHADLLHRGKDKEGNDFEPATRKPSATDFTVQTPARSVFSPSSNSQNHDYDEKSQRAQMGEQQNPRSSLQVKPLQPFPTQFPNHPYEQHPDVHQYQVPDREASVGFPPQSFGPTSVNQNPIVPPPQYAYGMYASDGAQQHYGSSQYELARSDSAPEAAQGQGSLSSYGPGHSMNAAQKYPQTWNLGPTSMGLELPLASQGTITAPFDPQGRGYFAMDYAQNMGNLPQYSATKDMESRLGGRTANPWDGNRVLAQQPLTRHSVPSIPPPHLVQTQRGRSYPSDSNHDAPPGFGWQLERRDSFGRELD